MAVRSIPIDPAWTTLDLSQALHRQGFDQKHRHEALCCFDVLRIWQDRFEHLGTLVSLEHLSGTDDPPDIIARFSTGKTLEMEHTSVEPKHRHWADRLTGGEGGIIPPVSGKYRTREELQEVIHSRTGEGWANTADEAVARCNLILEAMQRKIEKHPPGGVLVLDALCFGHDLELPIALGVAFDKIHAVPGAERWAFSFISRINYAEFYSAMHDRSHGFHQRRSEKPRVL